MKISIIGLGRVGSGLAYSLITNPRIDEIVLMDAIKERAKGSLLDISHGYPEYSIKLKVGDYEDTEHSDVIVITAGKPRTKEINTRLDLLKKNKKIITEIIESIGISKKTILIILTNPVEALTYLAYKLSGLDNKKVIGFSNVLDSERLRFILSQKTRTKPNDIRSLVIGEHGENMIPVFSFCRIAGKSLKESDMDLEGISYELKNAGKEIIKTTGGTCFGPVAHLIRLINAIINDANQIFPVSFYIEKEKFYGIEDVCLSLPVKINKGGISEILKINLNEDEREKLKILAKELIEVEKSMLMK